MKNLTLVSIFTISLFFSSCFEEAQPLEICKGSKKATVRVENVCVPSAGVWGKIWLTKNIGFCGTGMSEEDLKWLEPVFICEGAEEYKPKGGDIIEIEYNLAPEKVKAREETSCMMYLPSLQIQITSIKVVKTTQGN